VSSKVRRYTCARERGAIPRALERARDVGRAHRRRRPSTRLVSASWSATGSSPRRYAVPFSIKASYRCICLYVCMSREIHYYYYNNRGTRGEREEGREMRERAGSESDWIERTSTCLISMLAPIAEHEALLPCESSSSIVIINQQQGPYVSPISHNPRDVLPCLSHRERAHREPGAWERARAPAVASLCRLLAAPPSPSPSLLSLSTPRPPPPPPLLRLHLRHQRANQLDDSTTSRRDCR